MAQDIKVRNIQVEGIQSPAPQPISGDDFISVNSKLRYTEGFVLDNDYDLVNKSYVDENVLASNYFTDNETSGISVNLTTGVITVTMAIFPTIAERGIIRGNFDVKVGSDWFSLDQFPEVTKDIDGTILTAVFYLNQSFDEIRGRIF